MFYETRFASKPKTLLDIAIWGSCVYYYAHISEIEMDSIHNVSKTIPLYWNISDYLSSK